MILTPRSSIPLDRLSGKFGQMCRKGLNIVEKYFAVSHLIVNFDTKC